MKSSNQFIEVIFPVTQRRCFTYEVPADIDFDIYPGQRVVAPLRNIPTVGFIVNVDSIKPGGIKIKPIIEIIDPTPIFSAELFSFLKRLSNYYLTPLGKVLSTAIPAEYRLQKHRRICITGDNESEVAELYKPLYNRIFRKGDILLSSLKRYFDSPYIKKGVALLKKRGLISEYPTFQKKRQTGTIQKIVRLTSRFSELEIEKSNLVKRAPRQWEIINALKNSEGVLKGSELNKFSQSALQSLINKNLVSIAKVDTTIDNLWKEYNIKRKNVTLNSDQESAFNKIRDSILSGKFSSFLLQGLTGSGKTEVYIKLIKEAISSGKSTIILVPEITLTTHLAGRFRGEFRNKIAIWHSYLSRAQRNVVWRSILKGKYPVVIGARSAIFLPIPDLGLIIVDEEQDSSYKQRGMDPRYHARDAALIRGLESNATVVLGSATPSLESQYNAVIGKLTKVELPRRHSKVPSPIIHVVDLKEEWKKTGNYNDPFSSFLLEKIKEKVNKKQQVLLLQNRRGYSNVVLCSSCGWVPSCRNCDISLTYHKKTSVMMCHYCNLIERPPSICPKCDGTKFLYPGFGTQKVESVLKETFPEFSISRLDLDTTPQKDHLQRVMRKFEKNEIQILLGTQMIAKGLDFPNVSLVGVLNADIGLYMPDFRARERVFQLLYQVAGRSGRGNIQGEVVIQTFNQEDFTIRCAIQQNLVKFSNFELNERNPTSYPPFSRLALILISDSNRERASEVSKKVVNLLIRRKGSKEVLGPTPAPLSRIKNRYRFLVIIKSRKDNDPNGASLRRLLVNFINSKTYNSLNKLARITIDIDPLDLL